MPSLPSVTDLKTYLGLTTTADDSLIAQILVAGVAMAERDTDRSFASGSNSVTRYSTNLETVLTIHDRPFTDSSRTVVWNGTTLTEGTNCWFLPDRRDQTTTHNLQMRVFGPGPYRDFNWFDGNHDSPRYGRTGIPNDLVITGIIGMPFPAQDVVSNLLVLDAFLYWRAKSGASGSAFLTTGEAVSLSETPPEYQRFVDNWKIRTAVNVVG